MNGHVLVVDQGTTSTRSIIFGPDAALVAMAQEEFPQIFPQPGWVEHDPEDRSGEPRSRQRGRLSRGPASSRARSPGSGSPTSAKRRWSGAGRPAVRSTTRSSGRIAARRRFAPNSRSADARRSCPRAPACCSIPISRRRKSPGSSTMFPARALKRSAETWPSAPSTAFSSGG